MSRAWREHLRLKRELEEALRDVADRNQRMLDALDEYIEISRELVQDFARPASR